MRHDLVVIDTFSPSGTALFLHADNSLGAVPEPGTVALLALGFAGLAATGPRNLR